jgi:hypothetical protein
MRLRGFGWGVCLLGAMVLPPSGATAAAPGPRARIAELERKVAALEARMTDLESAGDPLALAVDCGAGQKVADALAAAAKTFGPVTITLTGVCQERVEVHRDDVSLRGAGPTDGLASPPAPLGRALVLVGARRADLRQLRLAPSSQESGIELLAGATLTGFALTVVGGNPGMLLWEGAYAEVYGSELRDVTVPTGIVQAVGGHLVLSSSLVAGGAGSGITVTRGGSLAAFDVTVSGNTSTGISVLDGAHAFLGDVVVTGGRVGLSLSSATASVSGGRVAGASASGITIQDGGHLSIGGGAIVEDHASAGIFASGGSSVAPTNVTIRDNTGSGIALGDTSLVRSFFLPDKPAITGNGGFGVYCDAAPAVNHVTPNGLPAVAVTGNGQGASNCPALGIAGRVP